MFMIGYSVLQVIKGLCFETILSNINILNIFFIIAIIVVDIVRVCACIWETNFRGLQTRDGNDDN